MVYLYIALFFITMFVFLGLCLLLVLNSSRFKYELELIEHTAISGLDGDAKAACEDIIDIIRDEEGEMSEDTKRPCSLDEGYCSKGRIKRIVTAGGTAAGVVLAGTKGKSMNKCKTCGAPVNLAPDGDPKYDQRELNQALNWNHRVSVCKDHTGDIVDGECVICDLEAARAQALADRAFQTENAKLRQELEAARGERDAAYDRAEKICRGLAGDFAQYEGEDPPLAAQGCNACAEAISALKSHPTPQARSKSEYKRLSALGADPTPQAGEENDDWDNDPDECEYCGGRHSNAAHEDHEDD